MEQPRIDLAHEPAFAIGPLRVFPSTREIERDGEREVIEPRVMQVFVVLYRARGAVVSKDDLAARCWEGRVVGEDAINRVISRLRKLSKGLGIGAFEVETVTRVGYRMLQEGQPADRAGPPPVDEASPNGPSRRVLVLGALSALSAVGAGLFFHDRGTKVPTDLITLIQRADVALSYASEQQTAAAVGLLQEASRLYPDRPEAWGKLADAYRRQAVFNRVPSSVSILDRAEAAARRALKIDPDNVDGAVVLALGRGLWYSSYVENDISTKRTLARFSDSKTARSARAVFLYETGQIRQSLSVGAPLNDDKQLVPRYGLSHARKLWAAGRLDEAQSIFDKLSVLWPRHLSIWRAKMTFLQFTGQMHLAQAMLNDSDGLPDELSGPDFQLWQAQTNALSTRSEANIANVLTKYRSAGQQYMNRAEEGAVFAASLGRLDEAFAFVDLYAFSGDEILAFRESFPKRFWQPQSGKLAYFFFEPPFSEAHADPRFNALAARVGLMDYWQKASIKPDYLV